MAGKDTHHVLFFREGRRKRQPTAHLKAGTYLVTLRKDGAPLQTRLSIAR